MSACVVVPLSITDSHRERAYEFVSARLADDGWPVIATGMGPDEPWCKASAVRACVDEVARWGNEADVVIVHDADVVVDLVALRGAVSAIEDGRAEWAMPHGRVLRLTESASAAMYAQMPMGERPELVRWPYLGIPGGGCTVMARTTYDDCPLDERFIGWGDEDQSWGWALETLHGAPWRAETADLWHLWHPPSNSGGAARSVSLVSNRLRRAYRSYRDDPLRMRALVADAH